MKTKEQTYKRLTEIVGKQTYRETAQQLNTEGHKTPQGMKWKKQNVASWAFNHRKQGKVKKPKAVSIARLSAQKKIQMIERILSGQHP